MTINKGSCSVTVYQTKMEAEKHDPIIEKCVIEGTSSPAYNFKHTPETAIKNHADKACECGVDNAYVLSRSRVDWGVAKVSTDSFEYVNEQPAKTGTVDPYEAMKRKKKD
jgi:hypothetical protein